MEKVCCRCNAKKAVIHSYDDDETYCKNCYGSHLVDNALKSGDWEEVLTESNSQPVTVYVDWNSKRIIMEDDFRDILLEAADANGDFSYIDNEDYE